MMSLPVIVTLIVTSSPGDSISMPKRPRGSPSTASSSAASSLGFNVAVATTNEGNSWLFQPAIVVNSARTVVVQDKAARLTHVIKPVTRDMGGSGRNADEGA